MNIYLFLIGLFLVSESSGSFISNVYPKIRQTYLDETSGDPGEPLFLTPYIQKGKISKAQKAAKVKLPDSEVESYAGFLTVNETYNSNLYFWFFPAEYNPKNAPVLLWLQGGPGASSLFGLFVENGPFSVDANLTLVPRSTSWTKSHNVIYIDNPVGTGFSFTESDKGYSTNEVEVGCNLYEALVQFFTLFPDLQDNEFYVTGESYAGKYVPAISYRIHLENPNAKLKINMKGFAIGDGFSDPETMLDYGDYLYYIGLLDETERNYFNEIQTAGVADIQAQQFVKAFRAFDDLIDGDLIKKPSYFKIFTGYDGYFNFLQTNGSLEGPYDLYVQQASIRSAIHVGNLTYNTGTTVEEHLLNDIMNTVKPWIEELIDSGYKTLLYSGQVDIIVAHTLTQNFISSMNWSGAEGYKNSTKSIWKVNGEIAGYARNYENFTYVIVRNAGHMVPTDQPIWAYDMLARFINNKPF